MKKENIIWLAVGGLAVYLFLQSRKKATAQPAEVKESTPTSTPTPTPSPIETTNPISGMKPPSLWTNDELQNFMTKTQCRKGGAAVLIKAPQPNPYTLSLIAEAQKRGIKAKCPDYGKYPTQ